MAKTYTINNPSVGGIAARTISFPIPEEGEIFRESGGGNYGVYILQGGKVRMLSPTEQTAYGEGVNFNPADAAIHPFISKELGYDVGKLPEYNIADISQAFGKNYQAGQITPAEALKAGTIGGMPTTGATEEITGAGALTYKDVPATTPQRAGVAGTTPTLATPNNISQYSTSWQEQAQGGLSVDWITKNINPATGKSYSEEARSAQTAQQYGGVFAKAGLESPIGGAGQELLNLPPIDLKGDDKPLDKDPGAFVLDDYAGTTPDLTTQNGRLAYYQQELDNLSKKLDTATAGFADDRKDWLNALLGKETTGEASEGAFADIGVDPEDYFKQRTQDVAEVGSLMASYNATEAQMNTAIASIETRPGVTNDFITRESNAIQKRYNAKLNQQAGKINVKLAMMEMESGNFEQARNFVREAVQNYTADLATEYKNYELFLDNNQDIIEDLQAEYKDVLVRSQASLLNDWKNEETRVENVGELLLDYPTAGIDIENDSYKTALAKAGASARAEALAPVAPPAPELLSVSEAKSLGVPYGTTKQQAMQMGIVPGTATTTSVGKAPQTSFIIEQLDSVLSDWDAVETKWKGKIHGRTTESAFSDKPSLLGRLSGARDNPAVQTFRTSSAMVGMQLARLVETGRLSDQDRIFYLGLMPSFAIDDYATAEAGVTRLKALLQAQLGGVESLRSELKFGEILVRQKSTGDIGAITSVEYNPQVYEIVE